MPKMGQKKVIATELRKVLGANVEANMGDMGDQELADRSGGTFSRKAVERLRKGQTGISLDKLAVIADALGCDPWQLLLSHHRRPVVIPASAKQPQPVGEPVRRTKKVRRSVT